jgi:hypothetical protein
MRFIFFSQSHASAAPISARATSSSSIVSK